METALFHAATIIGTLPPARVAVERSPHGSRSDSSDGRLQSSSGSCLSFCLKEIEDANKGDLACTGSRAQVGLLTGPPIERREVESRDLSQLL